MLTEYARMAINSVLCGQQAFCKFLSANDTGKTGGHQAGIYISKPSVPVLFNEAGIKGENKDKWVKIKWQNSFETDSRFIYYGKGTRNEYRITNFGINFPFLNSEYTGALFVLVKQDENEYTAFILNTDADIEEFMDALGISPADTNNLIKKELVPLSTSESIEIQKFIAGLSADFPVSEIMSSAAQKIENSVYNHIEYIQKQPDTKILNWINMEYKIFKALEENRYSQFLTNGFSSIEDFIKTANIVLNRRKSRAGKSLEHHLSAIFDGNYLSYTAQAVTEGNKKPDFIFPSVKAYHDKNFPAEKLLSLAAKTTCKDRWRQVINEADRLRNRPKYLCTLQQGISAAQMDEMQAENVILVVPAAYIKSYPADRQHRIWSLQKFINYVKCVEEL